MIPKIASKERVVIRYVMRSFIVSRFVFPIDMAINVLIPIGMSI